MSHFFDGDWAIVEMSFDAITKGGFNYYEDICFICRYEQETIVEVRLYVDTAGEIKVFSESQQ